MKVIGKMTGLRLLEEIANNNLSCGTMIRYKRDDLMLMSNPPQPVYEYYKYTAGDKRFHRCDENGKLGATGQQIFMNYSTLKKVFEIVEEDENPLDDGYEPFKEEQEIEELPDYSHIDDDIAYNWSSSEKVLKDKINELIKAVNELKKNER